MIFCRLFILCLLLLFAAPAFADLNPGQLNLLGKKAFDAGRYLEALDYLRRASQGNPYDETIRRNLAEGMLAASRQLAEGGRWDEAVKLLREGEERYGDDIRFPLFLAENLLALDRTAEAEVELGQALGIDPDSAMAKTLLGRVYYRTGRLRDAIDIWRQAAAARPDDANLADMLAKAEREYRVEADMERDYAPGFVLSYDGEIHADIGRQILDVLNDAYIDIGGYFSYFPQKKVEVLLYTSRDFSETTKSPDWAGGLYDGKVRIPLGGVHEISPHLRALLYHEYAHVVVRGLARGRCPTWLNEGIAEVMERSQFDPPLRYLPRAEKLIPFARLAGNWGSLPAQQARLAYEQSYSFVRYLGEYYGWYLVGDLLAGYAQGESTEEVFARVFGSYGLDFAALQNNWRQSLGRF
ncbi:tetratricopeptide repeat protein [Geothermobacter ehrlichii]|uniref:Tetratricopeptide repeat protein n=1 Tax=Geothermobacter ehrlichii TaxID=213224 RepID=A0A5D3WQ19_9BACT|nr:tetratricopeptide repeat protein [Geothermobacter ehrlichii]TYO99899.1 tetratricopeptide repeat protein [Geothermobacter ehrlichii]